MNPIDRAWHLACIGDREHLEVHLAEFTSGQLEYLNTTARLLNDTVHLEDMKRLTSDP